MFLAFGILLPYITTMNIPDIAKRISPMHIPVFLCGLVCGWKYGLAIGFITPLLRSLLAGMPALYPDAIGMAFELATYGLVAGLIYSMFRKKNIVVVYASLIPAMLAGRLVWGAVRTIIMGFGGVEFGWVAFYTSGFVNAVPGLIVQLVLIPVIMEAFRRGGIAAES